MYRERERERERPERELETEKERELEKERNRDLRLIELRHISTTMISDHFRFSAKFDVIKKSLSFSKSMPQKSNYL